jgi:hypothetical protein
MSPAFLGTMGIAVLTVPNAMQQNPSSLALCSCSVVADSLRTKRQGTALPLATRRVVGGRIDMNDSITDMADTKCFRTSAKKAIAFRLYRSFVVVDKDCSFLVVA